MLLRVDIKKPVLHWALERTRIPIEELKKKSDFRSVEKWISGELAPTFNQAEKLAQKARIPFGFLLLDEPVNARPDIPDFRTMDSQQLFDLSPDLEDLIYLCKSRLSWYIDFARKVGEPSLDLSGKFRTTDDITVAVQEVLHRIDWFPGKNERGRERVLTLSNAIEDLGVLVMRSSIVGNTASRKLDIQEFRGFTLIEDHYPLIFINGSDSRAGQLFSLAHELGHVLLGEPGITGDRNDHRHIERWCNLFAAELLLPAKEIEVQWHETHNVEELAEWAYQHYGVSTDVTVWKLVDSHLLDREEAITTLRQLREARTEKQASGGNFKNNLRSRLGNRFIEAVTGAVVDGLVSQQDAARQLGIAKTETFLNFVEDFQQVRLQDVA